MTKQLLDLESLKLEIKKILEEEKKEIRMYFYAKNKKIYQTKLLDKTFGSIKEGFLNSLYNTISACGSISKFDLDGNLDSELVWIDPVEQGIEECVNLYNLVDADECMLLEESKIKSFYNNVLAVIININNVLTIVKKFSYPKRLLKKSILNFKKYPLEQVEEDIFSIDNRIDIFELKGYTYILNNNIFEQIFSLETKYKEAINSTIENLKNSDIMEGIEEFKEECLNHKTRTKKLLKLLDNNNFSELSQKKNLIKEVIDEYNLSVKLTDDGKIKYSSKEEIGEILNILGDNYFISSILKKKKVAKASEEI